MKDNRRMEIVEVTPAIANEWLKLNNRNRPLREGLAKTYAETMKKGEWKLTAEPIMFSAGYLDADKVKRHGKTLMEGQHRLTAITISGVTIPMTVIHDCDPTEFEVIGQGRKRDAGDVLALIHSDLKHPGFVVTVVNAFLNLGMGYHAPIEMWLIKRMLHHIAPDVAKVVTYRLRIGRNCNRSMQAALLFAQLIRPSVCEQIVSQLVTGIGFTKDDPIRILFKYLTDQALSTTGKDSLNNHFAVCTNCIAWRLQKLPMHNKSTTLDGLGWLRSQLKTKLNPMMTEAFGSVPNAFYTPQIRSISNRHKKLRRISKKLANNVKE